MKWKARLLRSHQMVREKIRQMTCLWFVEDFIEHFLPIFGAVRFNKDNLSISLSRCEASQRVYVCCILLSYSTKYRRKDSTVIINSDSNDTMPGLLMATRQKYTHISPYRLRAYSLQSHSWLFRSIAACPTDIPENLNASKHHFKTPCW